MKYQPLSSEEENIIVHRGTEAPFSGEYENFSQKGIYICRRCGASLYRSEDKFDAHCGWPSFDAEIAGAARNIPDADGRRTEIRCARCDAHLGHVFTGEQLTPKDVRHCVNSLSMRFVPQAKQEKKNAAVYFGGGCFWCTEATFQMIRGVVSVVPGYAGGTAENPSYEAVSSGATGHAEVVKITYDPTQISYEALLEIFFVSHDPTTPNRQGSDTGTQYRSVVLYENDLEKEIVESFIRRLTEEGIFEDAIVTEVAPLGRFYEAEDYHHDYFVKHPEAAYCQTIIAPKLAKLRGKLKRYFKEKN